MKRALIIAYHFPPDASSGTFRTLKFVKYLDQFGWQPLVLTVAPEHELLENKDPALLAQVPASTIVVRTYAWSVAKLNRRKRTPATSAAPAASQKSRRGFKRTVLKWLQFPDRFIGWFPFAVWRGWRLARLEDVHVIYTSAPPFTGTLVGMTLKLLTGKPLVSDFRDPWIGDTYIRNYPPLLDRLARWLERRAFSYSARVLNISSDLTGKAAARSGLPDAGKFLTITNGFDPADFLELPAQRTNGDFRVTYTGSFYPGAREPRQFLEALALLARRHPEEFAHIEALFVGEPGWGETNADWLHSLALGRHVTFAPYLPHREALQTIAESNAVLMLGNVKKADTGSLPAKLFEYLATRKPILALVHEGESAEFVRSCGIGRVAAPDDPEAIAAVLLTMYREILAGRFPSAPNLDLLRHFDRRHLTGRLADVFTEVSARK